MNKTAKPKASCPACDGGSKNGGRTSHHDDKTIQDLVTRMNRIEGQIRGIRGMIERRVYCDDILNQMSSVNSALHGAAQVLLEKHMKSCVTEQLQSGDGKVVDELVKTVFKLIK